MSPDWKVKHLGTTHAQVFVQSLESLLGKRQPRQHLGCFECTVVLVQIVHRIPQCSHGAFGFLFCRDMKEYWKMPSHFSFALWKQKMNMSKPGNLLHSISLADHGSSAMDLSNLVGPLYFEGGISPLASSFSYHTTPSVDSMCPPLNDQFHL